MDKIDCVYCRVSTDDQTSNTSLPDQEAKCREYIERLGLDNIVVYKEDYSGFEFSRPELNKIIGLMKQGKVRSFTALRVDRIARKTGVLEELRDRYFKPNGIRVFTLDLMEWQWSAAHESLQDNLCLMGSFWGKILCEILQSGRKKHVLNGNVITAGHAPLGLKEVTEYDAKGKRSGSHIEFDEYESGIVLRIFSQYVNEDSSIARIANLLNEEGIPTYTEIRQFTSFKRYQDRISQTGHKWRTSTVRQILRETAYIGKWYFGKTRTETSYSDNGDKKKKKVRTDKNLIQVDIPALVPLDLWQAAQKKLDRNREEKRGRTPTHEYLFSKRIRCNCGMSMSVSARNGGRYLYYRCPAGTEKESECEIRNIKAELVDGIAWHWFYSIAKNKGELRKRILNYQAEYDKALESIRERFDYLNKALQKKHETHESMLANIFKLPELAQAKTLTMITQVETEIKELESEKQEIVAGLDDMEKVLDILGAYLGVFGDPQEVLADSYNPEILEEDIPDTYEKKLKYIFDFDLRVTILSKEEMRVSCRIGSEVLSLLNATELNNVQLPQRFYLNFSDILKLDFTTLEQFKQTVKA